MPANDAARPQRGKDGYYLYGFVAADAPSSFGAIGIGGPGDEVFTVSWKNLAAVVSRCPAKNPAADPEKALAHVRVLERIMGMVTIVPAKFGTMLASQHMLTKVLENNAAELRQILTVLVNKVELGLKVAWRKEALQAMLDEMAAADPQVTAIKQAAKRSDGNGLQLALALGELVQKKMGEKADQMRRTLLAPLEKIAVATRPNEIRTDRMIMNEAFLVDRPREPEFDQAVEEMVSEYEARLEFMYTGPWPPFNFALIGAERAE